MIDKTQDRQDVMEMRKLFWQKVEGKISHDELMAELDRINNRQMTLIREEVIK